ncbi:MAG: hypothetical protein V4615_10605 [Bacteroidota bacterium]
MKKLLLLTFILVSCSLYSQSESLLKPGRVIFYNVENLFDTLNDPETQDEDFLPASKNKWNTKKYRLKLNHIAKVFAAMLDTIQPLVIGLCEVENRKVLEDLIAQPLLKKFHFRIVHHNSPDERGIDAAILYNTNAVQSAFDATLKVQFPFDPDDRTRDILYLKTYLNEGEPVWFFVNHWPSRRGGKEDSDDKRQYAAKVLKDKIENIYAGEQYARIVVMGDFNDNPDDESLLALSKLDKNGRAERMVNLMKPLKDKNEFTLRYMDARDVFDQFIVSENLLDTKNPFCIRNSKARIFSPDFLLFKHPKYGLIPNRTYTSGRWVAGYSDHLPVYMDIEFK